LAKACTKQFSAPTKPFLSPREDRLKPKPITNAAIRTTRFGHVGLHHQPDLPLVAQELSGIRPQAAGTQSIFGVRIERRGLRNFFR
jgi:hypothetical protein